MSECILLLLQKDNVDSTLFGYCRCIRGYKKVEGWTFELSKEYLIGSRAYELFGNNSYENISKLARYSVLKDGNPKEFECNIDENYWFKHLKE